MALLTVSLSWISASASAQEASQPASSGSLPAAPTPAPSAKDKSKTPAKAASTPDADPSGGQTPAKAASTPDADQSGGQSPATPAPAKKPSTAEDNPFPEDISRKAAAEAKAAAGDSSAPNSPTPAAPNPASPPAPKQEQGSSSLDNTDKLGLDDPARKQLKLQSPDGSPDAYDPKRATEDVRVGKFYLQTGYYKGAYDRFKDATAFDHENVEAVFWLAEAARKMNLDQEAEQNYQLYLEAVPDGPNAKIAKKALNELASVRKP